VHSPHDAQTDETVRPVATSTSGAPETPQNPLLVPDVAYVEQSPKPASNTPLLRHAGSVPAGTGAVVPVSIEGVAVVGTLKSTNGANVGAEFCSVGEVAATGELLSELGAAVGT
jgi:hypothetical protein